jgi:dipeptidyl aminopeptidase/acylaminoacyl peptidase
MRIARAWLVAVVGVVALLAAEGQEVRTFSTDAGEIAATVYRPTATDAAGARGLVVHLYGSNGSHVHFNLGRPPYAELRRLLAEQGYWVVVPDLGPRHWMNDEAARSLDAVIAAMIAREGVDPRRVHLFGTSMGGGSSLVYVTRRPGKIASVVAVFPMTDYERWLNEAPRYREPVEAAHGLTPETSANALRKLSPLHHADAFRETPVFLIHGDADEVVPPHHSRLLAAALATRGCNVTYRERRGVAHQDEIVQGLEAELAAFLTAGMRLNR